MSKETRMRANRTPRRPELDVLLGWARGYTMSKEEIAAQRKSWVIGEMMLEHEEMTRAEAERIYNDII